MRRMAAIALAPFFTACFDVQAPADADFPGGYPNRIEIGDSVLISIYIEYAKRGANFALDQGAEKYDSLFTSHNIVMDTATRRFYYGLNRDRFEFVAYQREAAAGIVCKDSTSELVFDRPLYQYDVFSPLPFASMHWKCGVAGNVNPTPSIHQIPITYFLGKGFEIDIGRASVLGGMTILYN